MARVGPRGLESGASHSGRERNHLFLSHQGEQFEDISGISGLDNIADGRSYTLLDYDRDGWLDIAMVNANAPQFELFRNRIGDGSATSSNGIIALRFVGGNVNSQPAPGRSNRDGIGARVRVQLPAATLQREHRAGEGFAGQNSATIVIGIGDNPFAESATVRWPSGIVQEIGRIPAGALVTVYENPAASPSGEAAVLAPYRHSMPAGEWDDHRIVHNGERIDVLDGNQPRAQVVMYTTMATWCIACQKELPLMETLRNAFSPEQLAIYGVPVDPEDDVAMLRDWVQLNSPPYEVLVGLPAERVEQVTSRLNADLKIEAIPSTILTDGEGRVLRTLFGEPSISQIRALLAESE